MRPGISTVFLTFLLIPLLMPVSFSSELESRHTTIAYEKDEQLREFNDRLRLKSLSYLMRNRGGLTVSDEVRNKVDVVIERVESVLEMFPKTLKVTIVLLSSEREVKRAYKNMYGKNVDFVAFYSPREKTVYLSVDNVNLYVLAHEVAHAVIDQYFGVSPSTRIHEVLAQYAEEHLED